MTSDPSPVTTESELGEAGAMPGVLDDDDGLGEATGADDDVAVHRVGRRRRRGGCAPARTSSASAGDVDEDGASAAAAASDGRAVLRGQDRRGRGPAAADDRRRRDALGQARSSSRGARWLPSASRAASFFTGVKRHSSSRPVGSGNAATSNDAARSARDCWGTKPNAVALCGSTCVVGGWRRSSAASVSTSVSATGHQPTAPSIWSSMRRLSSRAYSIGSSRAIGSMKPRTIIAMASSSAMPRDMR